MAKHQLPDTQWIVITRTFFEPKDIECLLDEAAITQKADLDYAARDDPRYSGPSPETPPPGTYRDSLAERCAKDLHFGLRYYVERRLLQEYYPTNSTVRAWAERIVSHTEPLLLELGFERQELPEDKIFRPEGGERWRLPATGRLSLFAHAAGARREELEEAAAESSRWAFESWTIDAPEVEKAAYALHVLHEMAKQTIAYNKATPSRRGRKSTLSVFFLAIMEAYETLTGDYAAVHTNAITGERYGPALEFALATLALANERLVDGSFMNNTDAVPMERFRKELRDAATPDAIERRFRLLNAARRKEHT